METAYLIDNWHKLNVKQLWEEYIWTHAHTHLRDIHDNRDAHSGNNDKGTIASATLGYVLNAAMRNINNVYKRVGECL